MPVFSTDPHNRLQLSRVDRWLCRSARIATVAWVRRKSCTRNCSEPDIAVGTCLSLLMCSDAARYAVTSAFDSRRNTLDGGLCLCWVRT